MINVIEKLDKYIYEFIIRVFSDNLQIRDLRILARKSCIIKQIVICVKRDSIVSLRQLYYYNPLVFKNQKQSNRILGIITKEVELTREQLHIYASEKGLISGDNVIINNINVNYKSICIQSDNDVKYNTIPNGVKPSILSKLNFVLIVEKETIFKKFISSEIHKIFNPCVIVCTKGFPGEIIFYKDFATTNLLNHLQSVDTKFYILTDYNPHGLLIALTLHRRNNSKYYSDSIRVENLYWLQLLKNPQTHRFKESFTRRDKAILLNLIERNSGAGRDRSGGRIIPINNWSTIACEMRRLGFGYQLDSIENIAVDIVSLLNDE